MPFPLNMTDYAQEYASFSLTPPESFSFPLDVCDRWGDREALYWTDGKRERRFSFQELKKLSSEGAGSLLAMGIGRGDKVIVMLPAIPEWWEVMLALMRINAIPIPATTLLTAGDLALRLSSTDIKAVITTGENSPKVEEAAGKIPQPPLCILAGEGGQRPGWRVYRGAGSVPYEGERVSAHEPALIYFTSGTTGPPKMVLHTQASYPFSHQVTGKYWLDLRPGDLHWNLSDPGWAKAAWSSLFGPWSRGATVFSFFRQGKFSPSLILDVLERYPVTTFCGPPTAYRMVVKEMLRPSYTFRALRHCVAAGEPLNEEIITAWKERTGLAIYDGYGQTETVNILANFRCRPVKPGSMGLPVPGFVVDVIDESGQVLPPRTEGEIAVRIVPSRPAGLFAGYVGNPGATEGTERMGWYVTGDRAYKDEEGYFWFVGRSDDIILTSGYRIGPFEIESVLLRHPAVKESAVVASPDQIRGEVVKAFIVLTEGYEPSEKLADEIKGFVREQTAPYKYPREIAFVRDLPKTPSGKIRRNELRRREKEDKKDIQ